mmetsp:Transcript_80301/g.126651  ORF Transcript_80301/g.126651 Transcript_80301/m.126651 type:complete len:177 (+) Transcript_80301:100-630(+)
MICRLLLPLLSLTVDAIVFKSDLHANPRAWRCKELSASEKGAIGAASFTKSRNASHIDHVSAVGATGLRKAMEADNVLVVFWHPGCPSCNVYCADGNSPLESIHDSFAEENGPRVLKYNLFWYPLPNDFDTGEATIQVPRLQLANKTGVVGSPFWGNFYDYAALKAWVIGNGMMAA